VLNTDYTGELVAGKIEKGYFISDKFVYDVRKIPYLLVKLSKFKPAVPMFIARALSIIPYNIEKRVLEQVDQDGIKKARIEFLDITKLPKEEMKEVYKAYEAFIDWKKILKGLGVYKEKGEGVFDVKKILRIIGMALLGFIGVYILLAVFGVIH